MKLTAILLTSLIFLSSCTIDWNDEKSARIANLESQIKKYQEDRKDEIFAKKEACTKKYYETWDIGNQKTYTNLSVDVFYSQVENSCMIALDGWNKKDNVRVFLIADLFSLNVPISFSVDGKWNIVTKDDVDGGTLNELKCSFNKKLSRLKSTDVLYFNVDCAK